MDVLDYHTPRKAKPFPIQLTGGLRADAVTLIRGFFAIFLVCLLGTHQRSVCAFNNMWLAQWTSHGQLMLMRLDPVYNQRAQGRWSISDGAGEDFVSSIVEIGTVKKVLGVEVGYWPYANWIRLPFPYPLILSILAMLFVWRFTRLNPTETAPSRLK